MFHGYGRVKDLVRSGSASGTRGLRRVAGILAALVFSAAGGEAYPAQIWMGAMEPIWRSTAGWPPNDFMDLFPERAPWTKAASMIDVWFIHKKFAAEASDDEISAVISGLKRRNIALALQGVPLVASAECGRGVEAHGPPHAMGLVAARLKRLGADLRYVALDEPLFYGHEFPGNRKLKACHLSIAQVAAETAQSMAEVKAIFPAVKVGDIEPFGIHNPDRATWVADIREWLQAYQHAAGVPFAFFQADLVRSNPDWQAQFRAAVDIVRGRGIPLGIIYNGMRSNQTDLEWTEEAARLCHRIEREMGVIPDQAIFHSWMDRPRRVLPDTDPGTLTNLVTRYKRGCR